MDEKNVQIGKSLLETLYNTKALNQEVLSELPSPSEKTSGSMVELLKKHSLKIGIGIFQSVLTSSTNQNGEFTNRGDDLYDGHALFEKYSPDFQWISDWALSIKGDPIAERFKTLGNIPTADSDRSVIGVAVLYKQKDKFGNPVLIIGGAISSEHVGTWEGGRTNPNNFILVKCDSEEALDSVVGEFDQIAKGRDKGTTNNAAKLAIIVKTMTHDPEVIERMNRRLFRRLEIIDVADKRSSPRHIVHW